MKKRLSTIFCQCAPTRVCLGDDKDLAYLDSLET
jgi:hypothetical protein